MVSIGPSIPKLIVNSRVAGLYVFDLPQPTKVSSLGITSVIVTPVAVSLVELFLTAKV